VWEKLRIFFNREGEKVEEGKNPSIPFSPYAPSRFISYSLLPVRQEPVALVDFLHKYAKNPD
jgi:hypothetical protein